MTEYAATNEFVSKLRDIESRLSTVHGPFEVFAPIQRADYPFGNWDIIVSSPWTVANDRPALEEIYEMLKETLTRDEYFKINAVILLNPEDPLIRELTSEFHVEHGCERILNREIAGIEIDQAFIITSTRLREPVTA